MTYLPPLFEQADRSAVEDFLATHPFGTIVVHLEGELWPTPLPLIYRPATNGWGSFVCHVAKANRMWEADSDQDVLVIVNGPDAYVSPNWYLTKAETHEVVPTWNYAVVHAWGKMAVRHDTKFKRMAVGMLTQIHERKNDIPWKMGDAPQEYLAEELEHIVGLEIHIDRLVAKWKLSQNRSAADRAGVITGLGDRGGDDDMLHMMTETDER